MSAILSDNLTVEHKTFLIESGEFFRVREWRKAESESELYEDIKQHKPWRMPVTIVEVK